MRLLKNTFAALFILSLTFACTSNSSIPVYEDQQAVDTAIAEADSLPAVPEQPQTEREVWQILNKLVTEWNQTHNNKDVAAFARLYAEEVNINGTVYSNADAVSYKKQSFTAGNQTYQQILGATDVTIYSPFVAKASFIKKITKGKSANSVEAYLMFEKLNNTWKIVGESDEKTDELVQNQKSEKISLNDVNSCEKAAEAVFRSSPVVQRMLQSPSAKYSLEYTPGAPDNPNHRYWFWIYANNANNGNTETYGRFQVDPEDGQLYEFNALEDKVVQIPSDVALRQYMKKYCGFNPRQ